MMTIYTDRTGSIGIGLDNIISPRAKNISIAFHLVQDYVQNNYVGTEIVFNAWESDVLRKMKRETF